VRVGLKLWIQEQKNYKQAPTRVEATDAIDPDQWFSPEVMAEVLASEITESPIHSCAGRQRDKALSLRFPRFKRWRSEKAANQATHTKEIIEMYEGSKR